MAKIHVTNFYKDNIKQLLAMQDTVKNLTAAYEEGKIDEQTYTNIVALASTLKANVDRISYIVFLLNQPRFNLKKYFKDHEYKINYFERHKANQAGVFEENNTILQDMQHYMELMEEGKE